MPTKRDGRPSAKKINRRNREFWEAESGKIAKWIEKRPRLVRRALADMADKEKFPDIRSVPSMESLVESYVDRAIEREYGEPKKGAPRKDVLADEAIQLRKGGKTWREAAEALNATHGLGTTSPERIRQLVALRAKSPTGRKANLTPRK